MPLSKLEKEILAWVEEHYWEFQVVPTEQAIEDKYQHNPLSKPEFREALHKKYLLPFYNDRPDGFTAEQLLVLNKVCNQNDKRSLQVKLNECKITMQQWQVWVNDPAFMRHFAGRLHREFKNKLPEVMMAVVEQALGGDSKAQMLYLEMSGAYQRSANVNINVDVGSTLDTLVEILQEELDQATFERIVNRFSSELETPSKKLANAGRQLALSEGFDY